MKLTEAQKQKALKKRLSFQARCKHYEVEGTVSGSVYVCSNCNKIMPLEEYGMKH